MWIFGYGSLVWKADFPYVKKVVGFVKGYERKFWQASIDHRGVPEKPGRVVTLVPSTNPDTRVWGTAYKIHPNDIDFVIRHLDLRENTGYERIPEQFHPIPNHPMNWKIISDSLTTSTSTSSYDSSSMKSDQDMIEGSNSNDSGCVSDAEPDEDEDEEFEIEINQNRPMAVTVYFGSETNPHFTGPEPLDDIATQIFECSGFSGSNREYLFNLAKSMRGICDEALDSHLSYLEKAVRELENRKMVL